MSISVEASSGCANLTPPERTSTTRCRAQLVQRGIAGRRSRLRRTSRASPRSDRVARAYSDRPLAAGCAVRRRAISGTRAPDPARRELERVVGASAARAAYRRSSWAAISVRPVRSNTICASCALTEPVDLDPLDRRSRRALPLASARARSPRAPSPRAPPRSLSSRRNASQRPQARRVHPLEVVDRNHDARPMDCSPKHAEHSQR